MSQGRNVAFGASSVTFVISPTVFPQCRVKRNHIVVLSTTSRNVAERSSPVSQQWRDEDGWGVALHVTPANQTATSQCFSPRPKVISASGTTSWRLRQATVAKHVGNGVAVASMVALPGCRNRETRCSFQLVIDEGCCARVVLGEGPFPKCPDRDDGPCWTRASEPKFGKLRNDGRRGDHARRWRRRAGSPLGWKTLSLRVIVCVMMMSSRRLLRGEMQRRESASFSFNVDDGLVAALGERCWPGIAKLQRFSAGPPN